MDSKSMLDAVSLRAPWIFRVVDGQVTLGEFVGGSSRYPLRCDRLEVEVDLGDHALMRSANQICNRQQGSGERSPVRRRRLNGKTQVVRLIDIQPAPVVHVCFSAADAGSMFWMLLTSVCWLRSTFAASRASAKNGIVTSSPP